LAVIWDRYLASSFESAHIADNVQYIQRIVLNELLKALYNSDFGLRDNDKIELIETAQELFLP